MIRGVCKTNLDQYGLEVWPTKFVAVPRRGDRVIAESGRNLAVVEVSHGEDRSGPYIVVELHR